ncbi:MAG: class I SAM-dependent methyltransferase [Planctomycetia bacterium]|nr:class I SAM-dependent methyltransferase [Planctomycetia bacterium]
MTTLNSPGQLSRPTSISQATGNIKPVSWYERQLRHRIVRLFDQLPGDLALIFQDGDGQHELGNPLRASHVGSITVHDPSLYRMMVWQGSLGACEAYLQGKWTTPDLFKTLCLFSRIFDTINAMDTGSAWWFNRLQKLLESLRFNSRKGSRKNIAGHYDLSNQFFALFLDSTMMYSSACYDEPDMTLEDASRNKLRKMCRKLQLESNDHLLEIGTGWGGMAIHAARETGCRVTTTTISSAQHQFASQRIREAGLEDRIKLLQQDYRDLRGSFDKLVSIEMIEAVGQKYLVDYFRCCDRLLKPGGRMVIQAIVIPEQREAVYARSVDFIQRYIFPGSFLPSIAQLQHAVGAATRLRMVQLQDYTPSYVLTLREWRKRFHAQLAEVRQLGFDERFIRMWDFYLASCEAVFHERAAGLVQIEWVKQ